MGMNPISRRKTRMASHVIHRRPPTPEKNRSGIYALIVILLGAVLVIFQGVWVSRNKALFQRGVVLELVTEKIDCDYCGGLGMIRDPAYPTQMYLCPLCFGVGSHVVRRITDRDTLCPVCGGLGRVLDEPTGYAQTCPRCDGRGLIDLAIEQVRLIVGTNTTEVVGLEVIPAQPAEEE